MIFINFVLFYIFVLGSIIALRKHDLAFFIEGGMKLGLQGLLVQEPGCGRKVLYNIAVAQASTVKHRLESLTSYHLL